ncbi:replication-associated recombination protein A [Alteromonadaceae bacterium M269]|nr:replication-associated recombination protein A [Alteromonadaceae bacterium M269]
MTQEFNFSGDDPEDNLDTMPLAARMRPMTCDEYVGQSHIMGAGKPLRTSIEKGRLHSMVLWGPPGTGKTTLAELIARYSNASVQRISAVTSGVKDIRAAIEVAKINAQKSGLRTLLFVDEVHRFNKSQQDAFLPFIEDGTVFFVGATTENPSFELNRALLSRTRVYVLKSLEVEDLDKVLTQALDDESKGLGKLNLTLNESAKKRLLELSSGDARRLLNYLELCSDFSDDGVITNEVVFEAVGEKVPTFDKGGDQYYDLISAFHKSVRGSSPDAAVYWYARILVAGGDPLYVARRLLAIASEDIGNADPRALQVTLNAWDIFHRVGPAEGERAIAQAAIYCACAAKSNAVYKAFNQAKHDAAHAADFEVPYHLRNAPTELMKDQGFGADYKYAHDHPGAYVAGDCYLPEALKETKYYMPEKRGLEKQIAEKLSYLEGLDMQSAWKRYE